MAFASTFGLGCASENGGPKNGADENAAHESLLPAEASAHSSDRMRNTAPTNETRERNSCEPRLRSMPSTTSRKQRKEILAQLKEWMEEIDENNVVGNCGNNENADLKNGNEIGELSVSKPETGDQKIIYRRPTISQQNISLSVFRERCWSLGSRTEMRVVYYLRYYFGCERQLDVLILMNIILHYGKFNFRAFENLS